VRERLEEHRKLPACAGCHNAIDPVGLAFENFDGVGMWRDLDRGEPVDASGQLPDGTPVDGVASLADVLVDDPRFDACAVVRAFTWGHGRAPRVEDAPYLDDISRSFAESGRTLESLLLAVAISDTFRFQEVAP
jgi:hypothetical protein